MELPIIVILRALSLIKNWIWTRNRLPKLCMCRFYSSCHRKAQARFSFATYLTRVQYRLMSETSKNVGAEDLELANEQMVGGCLKYYSRKRIRLFSEICSNAWNSVLICINYWYTGNLLFFNIDWTSSIRMYFSNTCKFFTWYFLIVILFIAIDIVTCTHMRTDFALAAFATELTTMLSVISIMFYLLLECILIFSGFSAQVVVIFSGFSAQVFEESCC